jgi:hypothetical protein
MEEGTRACPGPVNLIAEDEDGAVGQLLVGQQRVELGLGLDEARAVAAVDQEDDGVDGRKVVAPDLGANVMITTLFGKKLAFFLKKQCYDQIFA